MKVLKVPLNAGSMQNREGLEKSPDLIEEETENFYMSEEETLPVFNFSDLDVDNSNLEKSHKIIEKSVSELNHFSVLLGGDHSLTLPSFKGFARGRDNPGLIAFDAHPDMTEAFGTHEDYLSSLIDEDVLKSENVVLVGLRNFHKDEVQYLKDNNIKYYSMKELELEGRREVCDSIMSVARQWSDIYLSVDIDVLDPAFAPGVSYREPGGLSTRELLYFLHRIKNIDSLNMADIVEVNADRDRNDLTVKVAAKLLTELS